MDTSTATPALKSKSVKRALEISPFGRPRPHASRRSHERRGAHEVGTSALLDARRDLSMFDPFLAPSAPERATGERLDPLLPPVVSEPLRRRQASARTRVALPAAESRVLTHRNHTFAGSAAVARGAAVRPASARRLAGLTARGRAAVLGLIIGGIALCSAITVGQSETPPPVESIQVVARGGESVEGVAERSAQGRDIHTVAESIRTANGLAAGEVPQAGEVLVVPGS